MIGYLATGPSCGATALFRLYLARSGDHFYTHSAAERDSAIRSGYVYEGIVGYVWLDPAGR